MLKSYIFMFKALLSLTALLDKELEQFYRRSFTIARSMYTLRE